MSELRNSCSGVPPQGHTRDRLGLSLRNFSAEKYPAPRKECANKMSFVIQRSTHITAFVATSIDGRISLNRKTLPDWTSKEDWQFFQKSLKKMDAVVVGRKTYEAARTRLKKRNTYVLSRSITRTYRTGSVTFINPDRVDIQDILGHHSSIAVLGGSSVYGMFFEQNLVDELYVTIEPLIFGRGISMVEDCTITTRFSLCCIKKLNRHGTVLMHYKKSLW